MEKRQASAVSGGIFLIGLGVKEIVKAFFVADEKALAPGADDTVDAV